MKILVDGTAELSADAFLFSASAAEQRLWFLQQMEPTNTSYNMPTALMITGRLDYEALYCSLDALVARHEALRTTFELKDGHVMQVIHEAMRLPFRVVSLLDEPVAQRERQAQQMLDAEMTRVFDLSAEPLLRVLVLQTDTEEHLLLINMHHIIADAWSMDVFFTELDQLYAGLSQQQPVQLPELAFQYADFSEWQAKLLESAAYRKQLNYWKQQISGTLPVLEMPTDRVRGANSSSRGGLYEFTISKTLTEQLVQLSQRFGATLNMTMLAAYKALLYRYTGQEDLLVGGPIANRRREFAGVIGFFINTLVFRTAVAGEISFAELLTRVKRVALDAYAHQDVPFDKLVEELQPDRQSNRNPIVQVMFVLEHAAKNSTQRLGLPARTLTTGNHTAKFDLTLFLTEHEDGMQGGIEYSTDLFEEATIARLAGHFQQLLASIVADPEQKLYELAILTDEERAKLLVQWNDTAVDYPRDLCVTELFEAHVRQRPEAVALVFAGRELTYRELNERANQVAHHLRTLGVLRGLFVGISMERSLEMIIGLLGILKAGATYIPLDPAYPAERFAYLLEDSGVRIVLTQAHLEDALSAFPVQLICLDSEWDLIADQSTEDLPQVATAEDVMYVSYTSGSTGKPKGVMVAHRSVVHFTQQAYMKFGEQDCFMQFASISFDAANIEVWGCLLQGARLAIFPPHKPSLVELGEFIEQQRVNMLFTTTGLFHQMADEQLLHLHHVQRWIVGGDAMSASHAKKVVATLPGIELLNTYGPTETTTFMTCYVITKEEQVGQQVSLGKITANSQVYILDRHLQPVPIGVPGELYIGGEGVACGYWQRPELTAERFLTLTFDGTERRVYKTGDLMRFRADGTLDFLGRIDNQVKIRGFRIELGEIEAVLSQHDAVQETIVMVREFDGDKRIIAYVVPVPEAQLDANELRRYLKQLLPDYMLPAAFVLLDVFPLNPNGKVDRQALAKRSDIGIQSAHPYVAPRNHWELQLATLWESVLGLRPVGVRDDFFELGGHSLLAVRLLHLIEKQFNQRLPLATLFTSGTIERLAHLLQTEQDAEAASPLIALQPQGANPPFFCVHPVGGGVFAYVELAQALGPEQPFYGLQARGLDGECEPLQDLAEMSASYIAAMRAVQPQGPYHVGGWSLGGVVAYEMAQQLQSQGEEVRLLALFDTYAPGATEDLSATEPEQVFARFAADLLALHGLDTSRMPYEHALGLEGSLQKLLDFAIAHQALPDLMDVAQLQRLYRVFAANIEAVYRSYQPTAYTGEVLLLCAAERAAGDPSPLAAWQPLAPSIRTSTVAGNHYTMFQKPAVLQLAEHLQTALEQKKEELYASAKYGFAAH